MNLLVITFAMDDNSVALAWQSRVVRELAEYCDRIAVLSDNVGSYQVPENVTVEAFRRPRSPIPRTSFILRWLAANRQAWQVCRRNRIDAVFLHMNHPPAYRLWFVFASLRLPVLLWYAHGSVTWHLRLALACIDRVVSSTPEGFRIPTEKVRFIGQGVDSALFNLSPSPPDDHLLITVSRLSRRKRIDLLLDVMSHLKQDGFRLLVVGAPLTDDDCRYEAALREKIADRKLPVNLQGFMPMESIPDLYRTAALHLNVSETNSMDKTGIESLACGRPLMTSNPAFHQLLVNYPEFLIHDASPATIADRVRRWHKNRHSYSPEAMRNLVAGKHDLQSYASRIMDNLHELAGC